MNTTDTQNDIKILIARYLAAETTDEENLRVESWIAESEENHMEFSRLRNIRETSHPAFDPTTIDVEAARARVMSQINLTKNALKKGFFYYWQRVAAILLLPLLAFSLYMTFGERQEQQQSAVVASNTITVPSGVRSRILLPDNSVVWLNGGSSLTYPLTFPESGGREVALSGEGYFEVRSDKEHPFTVVTSYLSVEATGTAFNVEAYAQEDITAVTLAHGAVNVAMSTTQHINIVPNQRFVYNSLTNRYNVINTDASKWSSWKDGMLMFRDDNLDYIFGRLSHIYNVDISIKDPEIGGQLYRATFRDESLDEMLNLIKLSAPIRYKNVGRKIDSDSNHSKRVIEVYKK